MARTIAKDHDEKRAHILASAAKVFATEGFDRASMTQLARDCGISKANIYHYYDGKEAILYDILETYLRELRDRVCGISLEGLGPEDRVRAVVREVLLAYQGSDHEHRVQVNGVGRLPADQQTVLRGYQREMVVYVGEVLKGVAPEALGQDSARLRSVTMSVFGMLNWYFMWNSGAGPEAREDYARVVADLTLNGVRGV
ncbi:TetR/AcrR family transcriptional regulator [Roseovarius sp.]|uniref:TetR/AcrR family transcriptional regulator n=1 Tax=Roseovarius sp. TaxID=1486281 RepID=UPI00260409FD|nr:TetR/AcrR family transcriptional regulator [Roseovarius sp.]MDM8164738.1 TetR/AcrR family transcriptional regulator [Roseovarius sp.]